jgi:hypothetical protein
MKLHNYGTNDLFPFRVAVIIISKIQSSSYSPILQCIALHIYKLCTIILSMSNYNKQHSVRLFFHSPLLNVEYLKITFPFPFQPPLLLKVLENIWNIFRTKCATSVLYAMAITITSENGAIRIGFSFRKTELGFHNLLMHQKSCLQEIYRTYLTL